MIYIIFLITIILIGMNKKIIAIVLGATCFLYFITFNI